MIRRVIQIDEEKCNGCGICVTACHEGMIIATDWEIAFQIVQPVRSVL